MWKNLSFCVVLLVTGVAGAQEYADGHGPGVGMESNLGGLTGASFVYDFGKFRIDALFGLSHESNVNGSGVDITDFGIAGRFFYVVHRMERADFGLGGGLGIVHESLSDGAGPNETNIQIELAAQIRVFLAPNVALLGSLGFAVTTADNEVLLGGAVVGARGNGTFGIGGQLLAGFGATYYFR
jgi:hypothetical protein